MRIADKLDGLKAGDDHHSGGVKGRTQLPGMVEQSLRDEIDLDSFVTHTMGLDDINRAFDLMHTGESIRSVILY